MCESYVSLGIAINSPFQVGNLKRTICSAYQIRPLCNALRWPEHHLMGVGSHLHMFVKLNMYRTTGSMASISIFAGTEISAIPVYGLAFTIDLRCA